MKGIIMAGGEGSRLRPLTCDLPKPMVPVMNRPVMTYSIELLKKYGITEIGATLQYLPQAIQGYFGDGSEYGVHLHYFIEESPLGTAGSVKNAGDFLDETFIVISGDALTDINLKRAVDFHKSHGSKATLVLKRVEVPLEYGVVVTDEDGRISRFLEKPNWGEVFSDTVNTGIYILEPEVLNYFEAGVKFDFSQDLFPMLQKDNQPMFGYISNEYWCDIGNAQTYLTAHYDMLSGRIHTPIPGHYLAEGIWTGEKVQIDEGARIEGPCYIGHYTRIRKDAYIGPYSVIGAHCDIEPRASVKRSVLWNHVLLGRDAHVRGAAICNQVELKEKTAVYEGAVIGDGCQLKAGSSVKPNVKLWPEKMVEEDTVVRNNLIWGTKVSRNLFGKDGIFGTINVDLCPQTITRMGAAFGACLKPGKRVAVSCDSSQGNNMLKYGLISGMISSGLEVFDLGQLTSPVLRYGVRHLGLDGGIHLYSLEYESRESHLHFVDKHGSNLPPSMERKIENLYVRDDFQRQSPEQMKRVHTMSDIPVFYIRNLMDGLNVDLIRKRNPRVLIASGSRIGHYLLSQVLTEVGCRVDKVAFSAISDHAPKGYDLVCRMEANCEDFVLFDEEGKPVSNTLLKVLIGLIYLKEGKGNQMPVANTVSSVMEKMAKVYDCSILRTKSSRQAVMEATVNGDLNKGTSGIRLFQLYFDGVAAFIKLVELMSKENTDLSGLLKDIPAFHVREKEIACPWDQKGRVMRSLIEEERKAGSELELFEGIRVRRDQGWALILPDSQDPVCRVYSEGVSEEYAEELAHFYEERITQISQSRR